MIYWDWIANLTLIFATSEYISMISYDTQNNCVLKVYKKAVFLTSSEHWLSLLTVQSILYLFLFLCHNEKLVQRVLNLEPWECDGVPNKYSFWTYHPNSTLSVYFYIVWSVMVLFKQSLVEMFHLLSEYRFHYLYIQKVSTYGIIHENLLCLSEKLSVCCLILK